MEVITITDSGFLSLLQLASSALPVGAYSYSEGLETLVENRVISDKENLKHWLTAQLDYGAIRIEAAILVRAYWAFQKDDLEALSYWNLWLSATRETAELRSSSWQMGRSLMRLLVELAPQIQPLAEVITPCNYAIAFGVAAACWNIDLQASLLAYFHSWAVNLITAGVKLIPLGQTAGQQILLELQSSIIAAAQEIMELEDEAMDCCSWGLSLASMGHETLYTRLFRS